MTPVSVILPIYNGENTLKHTLESLIHQTYTDFELIACIDGSDDGSEAILRNYDGKFKMLKILKNEQNRGLGPTMNRLVFESKGIYIAVAEQDDYYYPERLELQVDLLENNPNVGMVSGIAEFWNGSEISLRFPWLLLNGHQYPEGKAMFLLNYRQQIKVVNSCMMFKKQLHMDHGLYFTQHYHNVSVDWTYVLRFSLISNIYGLHQVLVRLDRRKNRTSITRNKMNQFKSARELIRSFAFEYPDIITKKDHQYARHTQSILEINQFMGLRFLLYSMMYIIRYPLERRFRFNFYNRMKKKIKP